MIASQAVQNGKVFLESKRTMILGVSPGNPYYSKLENLQRLFHFGKNNSEKVLLFLPDKISEHNYQAVGSKNCEKSARVKANSVRNKCNEAIHKAGLQEISHSYINWMEEVETSKEYEMALKSVKNLYQVDDEFYADIRDSTEAALRCLRRGREKGGGNSKASDNEAMLDLEEGVKYPLKELAFLAAVPSIYEDCEEFVFVYHRPWHVLEKFFDGGYDGIARPYLGFLVFE